MGHIIRTGPTVALLLTFGLVASVTATDESPESDQGSGKLEVVGLDFAFDGMPATVPTGTSLTLRNDGIEFHEMAVARISDDVTETVEQLFAMGEEAVDSGMVELIDFPPISALPGEASAAATVLESEGRYVLACFIPQGFVPERLAELGVTDEMDYNDPAVWPPEAQAILDNPPHVALGMYQEFTVVGGAADEESTAETEA